MKKSAWLVASVFCLSLSSSATDMPELLPHFTVFRGIFDPAPFIRHDSQNHYGTYLARNLPHSPFSALKTSVMRQYSLALFDRGESHITVITPPEYERLSQHINIDEINALAEKSIQNTMFMPLCLGMVVKDLEGEEESTAFIVVRADGLVELRRAIAKRFYDHGGNQEDFDPEYYFPHITLGYTKRDLHAEDGAVKDVRSCIANLSVIDEP